MLNKPATEVEGIEELGKKYRALKSEIGKVIIGQEAIVDLLGTATKNGK